MRFPIAILLAAGLLLAGCSGDDEPDSATPGEQPAAAVSLPPEIRAKADCKFVLVPALVGAYQAAEDGEDFDVVRRALGEDLPAECEKLDAPVLAEAVRESNEEAIALVSGALLPTESPSP